MISCGFVLYKVTDLGPCMLMQLLLYREQLGHSWYGYAQPKRLNPLPHMPIFSSSDSAANKDMMS